MRKKIGLAAALIHAPRLLVLDEPFEAVDPISALAIRAILRRFVAGGGAVVFSSHVMALVEQLCSHVAVLAKGRVLASGSSTTSVARTAWRQPSSTSSVTRHARMDGLAWLGS